MPEASERHQGAVQRVRKLVSSHGIDAKLHQRRSVLGQPVSSGPPEQQVSTASSEDAFSSERDMLLAAVAALREAAEAAMRRAEAAEAACFAPMKHVLEAHLREYKEHMASEIRSALQHEVSEATAELRATARELCMLCRSPMQHAPPAARESGRAAQASDSAQSSRLEVQPHTLPSLGLVGENYEVKRIAGTGSTVSSAAPDSVFTASTSNVMPVRVRVVQAQEDAANPKEVGDEEEDIEVRRRRSVRDVVSHFEKVNRSLPSAAGALSGSSSVDRLVPAHRGEELEGRSASHGSPHPLHAGRGLQLPGLTSQASREDFDTASHAGFLRRKSI